MQREALWAIDVETPIPKVPHSRLSVLFRHERKPRETPYTPLLPCSFPFQRFDVNRFFLGWTFDFV